MSEKMGKLFNIYGYTGGNFSGNVYGINGIAPTINFFFNSSLFLLKHSLQKLYFLLLKK